MSTYLMNLKIITKVIRYKMSEHNNFIVRLEGGLGAQIIGLSAYYFLKSIGCNALVDISYFDRPLRLAQIGKNEVTHWDWQLNHYGIDFKSFDWINIDKLRSYFINPLQDKKEGIEIFDFKKSIENYMNINSESFKSYFFCDSKYSNILTFFDENPVLVKDGPNKMKLFIKAMQEKSIKSKFTYKSDNWKNIIKNNNIDLNSSICLHLRRGDYLNVASHLLSEESVIEIFKKLPKLINNLIIFSDSESSNNQIFIEKLKSIFDKVFWLDNVHFIETHQIMRESQFLLCSNRQFSLTAAYLGENFSIIPQKFSADEDFIFQYENNQTSFALLNN